MGKQWVNNSILLKFCKFEKCKYWFIMLNKDLGWRPQFDIPWESNTYPIHKDIHAQSYVDKGTTHEHRATSWYKHALQCHILRKPFLNGSLEPLLSLLVHIYTHCSTHHLPFSLNPLRSSLSSHDSTKMAHQGLWAPLERPFLVPLEGHLIQILSTPHLSAHSSGKLLLPGIQDATLP